MQFKLSLLSLAAVFALGVAAAPAPPPPQSEPVDLKAPSGSIVGHSCWADGPVGEYYLCKERIYKSDPEHYDFPTSDSYADQAYEAKAHEACITPEAAHCLAASGLLE